MSTNRGPALFPERAIPLLHNIYEAKPSLNRSPWLIGKWFQMNDIHYIPFFNVLFQFHASLLQTILAIDDNIKDRERRWKTPFAWTIIRLAIQMAE